MAAHDIDASLRAPAEPLPADLVAALEPIRDRLELGVLARALRFSRQAHEGQRRRSGEDYVQHCIEVAKILAELQLDTASIASALLHDVLEDTDVTVEHVRAEFGDTVATIVDGLTKIGKFQFKSTTEQQAENYRKLLLSMAQDARVIIIKLADRVHNMGTLEALPETKRRRIALETQEIYAPLAHRLGMAKIRWELEDLAFKHLEPDEYRKLAKKIHDKRKEREELIARLVEPLTEELQKAGIPCEVVGRPKHLWSIYKKMQRRGKPYEEIYDLMAIRVITETVRDCYHALGVIHNKWTPLTERFHDYIATPKSNMYRSLHTTIFGPGGRLYEMQIRTRDMHRTAEYGIAAHWRYKEDVSGPPSEVDEKLAWLRQVLEWQQEASEPEEFMEFLRIDLCQDEIFVFTPKGDVKQLPRGATPIDFAFAVHTAIGVHCAGARVDGRLVPLSRELQSGDTVEILTDPKQTPSRDWLGFVKTARARQKIRQWIAKQEFTAGVALGKEFLERELRRRRRKATEEELRNAALALSYPDVDHLYAALGRGDVGPSQVLKQIWPEVPIADEAKPTTFERIVDRLKGGPRAVRIQGMDNVMVRYSQCCQPVPGDDVIGYITRGRGVSIHRTDCPNVLSLSAHPERRVEIDWRTHRGERFLVRIVMEGTDRRGLLSDIATAITQTGTNIQSADIKAVEGGMRGNFVVEVEDLDHLTKVVNAVRKVKGMVSVERRESLAESDLSAE
ncbi:MAG: bifunctional (p)ppGpp synthetase/guanosine-3',5'-bis(diphosphate) 3'-pyrophosphohydrolase [Gemmatimonadetes bacterium]|nr:bifunctional (p)ppGpp synthetase/guanosine-3',5'-bis(diphosphate) 3'-pyrophosphohydrolase [Gemmatimonadota bacterium]